VQLATVALAVCVGAGAVGCGDKDDSTRKNGEKARTLEEVRPKPERSTPAEELAKTLKGQYRELNLRAAQTEADRRQVRAYFDSLRELKTSCSPTGSKRVFNCSVSAAPPGNAPRAEQFRVSVDSNGDIIQLKPQ